MFTHQFASFETLNRARYWLTWHGFTVDEPRRSVAAIQASPRLAVHATLASAAAAHMLIDSIERSAPETEAAFASKRWVAHEAASTAAVGSSQSSGTPIHWQSSADASTDPNASRVAEYMFSRWE